MQVQDPVGLEARVAYLERSGLISSMASVEASTSASSVQSDALPAEMKDLIQEFESRFNSFDPEKESTSVRFGDLHVPNLKKMKELVLKYIPSLNYGAASDFHLIFSTSIIK